MLDPACPWSSLAPATSRFCEDAVCGLVREPANTWSNVGFVVAGLAMLRLGPVTPRLLRRFGYVCVFLGIGSALFHATRTYYGGLLDTAGMQATAAFMLAANARRLFPSGDGREGERRDARTFWLLAVTGTVFAASFEQHERSLYVLEMAVASVMELVILRRESFQRAHRWLGLSWVTFVPAYALWWLDLHHVACQSSAHVVNGHAAWHLLMAASLFSVQRFHAELATSDLRRAAAAINARRTGTTAESGSRDPARCRA